MNEYNNVLQEIKLVAGNSTTTNTELNKLGKKLLNNFKGAMAKDEFKKLKNGESCILNLDTKNMAGSHWIAVVKENNNYYVYDSFGRPANRILGNMSRGWKNTQLDPEQEMEEQNCGQRSLASLYVYENHGIKKFLEL